MTTYTLNAEKHGIEIMFGDKPDKAVRDTLKSLGFRWHNMKKCWYAKQSDERMEFAIKIANADEKPQAAEPVKADEPVTEVDFSDWGGKTSEGYMGAIRWDGSKSHLRLYGSDLSKAIRNDLKAHGIKDCTVSCSSYANGQTITVKVTAKDSDFTVDDIEPYKRRQDVSFSLEDGRLPITDEFKTKLKRIKQCLDSYRYDDSNAMVDYFNTNMYYHIVLK